MLHQHKVPTASFHVSRQTAYMFWILHASSFKHEQLQYVISSSNEDSRLYSVQGLERSELGGSHGCLGRLWDWFLWQVYQNDSRHDVLDGVLTCHKNRSQRRPGQPWDPLNSLRSKPRTEYRIRGRVVLSLWERKTTKQWIRGSLALFCLPFELG